MQGSHIIQTLREAKPTEFLGVPRIFEKFEELIESQMKESSPLYKSLYMFSRKLGYKNIVA
jgi:long-chain-fatty-acid--CoA ligase ACSBG